MLLNLKKYDVLDKPTIRFCTESNTYVSLSLSFGIYSDPCNKVHKNFSVGHKSAVLGEQKSRQDRARRSCR